MECSHEGLSVWTQPPRAPPSPPGSLQSGLASGFLQTPASPPAAAPPAPPPPRCPASVYFACPAAPPAALAPSLRPRPPPWPLHPHPSTVRASGSPELWAHPALSPGAAPRVVSEGGLLLPSRTRMGARA